MVTISGPDSRDARLLLRIAEAAAPAGRVIPAPDGAMIARVQLIVGGIGPNAWTAYCALARALDLAALPLSGRRLSKLALHKRLRVLERLSAGAATAGMTRAVVIPLKLAQAESPAYQRSLGKDPGGGPPAALEKKRWHQRISDLRDMPDDETLEVDAVIVGSGAGGAPIARSLAAKGHAVLVLEEGGHFTRRDFAGDPMKRQRRMFRSGGLTAAWGNAMIPVPLGRTVGGTTTVNSGTCFRVPDRVLRRWELEHGLSDLRPGTLDVFYDRVEAMLRVAPGEPEFLGGCARVIARGADALGYAHGALPRNAPGCDGQGECCFGCPTDAKRSTNVSYIPAALEQGAMVFTHARVTRVLIEQGRAVGVAAEARREDGARIRLTVRAQAVVLACGAVQTPALLLGQRLANGSGQVGRNLTIHPASYAWARFDEQIQGWHGIPQGYGVDEFVDQGIRFEGASLPVGLSAASLSRVGHRWTELVEDLDHMAIFGFMIEETSRGRVILDPRGEPQMTYWLNDADVRTFIRGQAILARIFLAAGARRVYPAIQQYDEVANEADAARLERDGPGVVQARHIDMSAYHPLGTCRMGTDPRRSVVGPTHESHDVPDLFICDGSTVSGPLGVNPQVTIMALAERASAFVERRIEDGAAPRTSVAIPKAASRVATFSETMAGSCELVSGEDAGRKMRLAFQVSAELPLTETRGLLKGGATSRLTGTLDLDGVATGVPCAGTLQMRPLARLGTLIYDLDFEADDGTALSLHGEKHVSLTSILDGMTTLYTEVRRRQDGARFAHGELRFDLRDGPEFLGTWTTRQARPAA